MRLIFVPFLVGLLACGGKTVVGGTTSGTGGTTTGSGGTTTGSGGQTISSGGATAGSGGTTTGSGGSLPTDGGVDECTLCNSNTPDQPAYNFNECTPPLEIGCPAKLCTLGGTDCGDGYTCDQWGAAACCWCQQALPACVFTGPAMGPLPEYLKIFQTSGPSNEQLTLRIQGFPFYVGALYYLARVGNSGDLMQGGSDSTCSFTVTVPGQADGMVPVWASQYGGADPWVLAGFFDWFSAGYPAACNQPGYPCGGNLGTCCETPDVPMACVQGRCRKQ